MIRTKLVAGLLVCALAGVALAADKEAKDHKGHGIKESALGKLITANLGRLMTLRSELNLTDEQKTKIHDAFKGHKKEIAAEAKQLFAKRNVLRDLVLSGSTDEAAIRKAADDLGKEIGNAAVLGVKVRDEVAPVLTDEQRAKIKKTKMEVDESVMSFLDKAAKGG